MAAKTTYMESLVLTWGLSAGAASRPTAWYVALHTEDPTNSGSVGEIVGDGYTRQKVTGFTITGNSATTPATLTFGPCTSSAWGNVSYFSIWTAVTNGFCLYHGQFDSARTIEVGDSVVIPSGQLTISEV